MLCFVYIFIYIYIYIYKHTHIYLCFVFFYEQTEPNHTYFLANSLLKQLGPSHLRLYLDQGSPIAVKLTSGQITLG